MRYAPPETCDTEKAWPRRYDTWSYGCITLEFIVWLLEGSKGLRDFHKRIVNSSTREGSFFETERKNGQFSPSVNSAVLATMQSLSQRPECQARETALGDLLGIVRTKLLVVALDPISPVEPKVSDNGADTKAQVRADSSTLKRDLAGIIKRAEKQDYWLKTEFKMPGTERVHQGGSPYSNARIPPAQTDESLTTESSAGEGLGAEHLAHEVDPTEDNISASSIVPNPVRGTIHSHAAIYNAVRPGSSAALSLDSTNAVSSKTDAYVSTNLTVPDTFGSIDQEISKVNADTEDDDQYSAAGSAASYDDQYVDIITTSLLRDLDPEDLLAVKAILPSLLKECAIRIGHEDHSPFHRKMMFFAHQHHR